MRTATIIRLGACLFLAACGGKAGGGGSGGTAGGESGTGGQPGPATGSGGTGPAPGSGGAAAPGTGGSAPAGTGGALGNASFEPMKVDATWSYDTTETDDDGGVVSGKKVVTVQANEAVPGLSGVTAWRIHTSVPGSNDQLTWQDEIAAGIVRYRDDVYAEGGTTALQSWDIYVPYKMRLDLTHLTTGAQSTQTYADTSGDGVPADPTTTKDETDIWSVFAASESITVPAGTFTAIHVQKLNSDGTKVDKDYWFVRGVGKVKETSKAGRTELLTSYHIP